jgi:hypothetical protein
MAKWSPPDSVGANERMGRRLFDEPMLSGAQDQRPFAGLLLTHFEENRGDDYSLDRLGKSGIENQVVRYLLPRAQKAATSFNKSKRFDGWAVLPAKELTAARKKPDLAVTASRIEGENLDGNDYHAHAVRPPGLEPLYMAYHLRHLFTEYGTVHEISKSASAGWITTLVRRVRSIVRDVTGARPGAWLQKNKKDK